MMLSSGGGQTFQVLADGATIRPLNGQLALVQITNGSEGLVLRSTRGTLEVSMGDEVKTIQPEISYRMEVKTAESGPEPGPGPQPSGTRSGGRNCFELVIIPAIVIATVYVSWRALVSDQDP